MTNLRHFLWYNILNSGTIRLLPSPMNQEKDIWVQAAIVRYEKPLLQHAEQIVRCIERAREIVQDTFMQLYKQEKASVETHLAQWLFTVCRNFALKFIKKNNRYVPLEPDYKATFAEESSPSDVLGQNEMLDSLISKVEKLSDNHRKVIKLYFWDELNYIEIGHATGLSAGNVGFILNKAKHKLRKMMNADAETEKFLTLRHG